MPGVVHCVYYCCWFSCWVPHPASILVQLVLVDSYVRTDSNFSNDSDSPFHFIGVETISEKWNGLIMFLILLDNSSMSCKKEKQNQMTLKGKV